MNNEIRDKLSILYETYMCLGELENLNTLEKSTLADIRLLLTKHKGNQNA